jgi:hypothetical protein
VAYHIRVLARLLRPAGDAGGDTVEDVAKDVE